MKPTATQLTIPPMMAILAIIGILLLLPELSSAQPLPPGPPSNNPTNPVPIDPASWLIPAGMGAYAWYKKRKEVKLNNEEEV
jgi:hypothetical protein